ncbi:MAG: winged helix-turn-helix domain-containing protein [Candidatus Thermoplasmatota archaeon]|nr:winged helix-turn-helix transcriptional regulator [Euryarchaeota archaeon]MBU4032548.1 winged helix-turn-helix domain-containing protein [Candidatus Thermoplasmatota archaeon]MBU4072021.1 winged helix-turn-helix domain-containing protein [Candidatus Thermoplasmatota archaeon]MBU4144552.1 winged helix-turn-helix domain-containing protein [Candidatus Thermoplasmatota archaeon]MBU4592101.1 winged helix-turn-helix domain-containing protein [Candidatus Thermoplasmatota archaeon]
MVDEIRVIDDPAVIKLVTDETRRSILELLRLNQLTVAQMTSILEKDQSTIYRHVEKLLKAGLIEQTGERKDHHIPEKVYGRTARIFFLAPGVDAVPGKDALLKHWERSTEKVARLLRQVGYEGVDEDALREAFLEIEKTVSAKIRDLKPDDSLNFYTIWKLQTAIIMLEMQKNPVLRKKIEKFAVL